MPVLSRDADLAVTGGDYRRLPAELAANPFGGSLLSFAPDGQAHELVAGEPFAGICVEAVETPGAADGARQIGARCGNFTITVTISGVSQTDAHRRRMVYASDDGTLTFTAAGNTPIGQVIGLDGTRAIVLAATVDQISSNGPKGHEVLADAAATLTVAQLDKILILTLTAGRILTLPPAAHCTGRGYTAVTLGAFAITLDGDAAETVNGAATFASAGTVGSVVRVYSTGLAWVSF